MIKYIDLFAGIGGFHYGIDKVSIWHGETSNRDSETFIESMESATKSNRSIWNSSNNIGSRDTGQVSYFSCVYSNEWDKYANSVYTKHFGECDNRDIRTVPTSDIPDFDLLCGGFPCQSFSVAGKRGGFNDTRGTMFFEIARILKDKRPRYLLLENVKGLLSHDDGKTFQTILGVLSELGYDVQWQVLNSKDFGVPQNRERIYIIGHLRGTSRPEVFPLTRENSTTDRAIFIDESQWRRENKLREYLGVSPTLNTVNGGGHLPLTTDMIKIRRLTPTECMRLQGFPDDWCDVGAGGELISDSQKYKMAGNAVTTNVVSAVISRLLC